MRLCVESDIAAASIVLAGDVFGMCRAPVVLNSHRVEMWVGGKCVAFTCSANDCADCAAQAPAEAAAAYDEILQIKQTAVGLWGILIVLFVMYLCKWVRRVCCCLE
jgi:methylaspartate ammonia-lyase